MNKKIDPDKLLPFALRSGNIVVGRHNLKRQEKKLLFVLITEDLSDNSRREVEKAFACPIMTAYTSGDITGILHLKNTKILGFRKSGLAASILKGLRQRDDETQ